METSQSLAATESFSYSWLTGKKPSSYDEFLNSFTSRFPENSSERDENFNFDIPVAAFPISLVHADEIFSDGHIMPFFVDRSSHVEASTTSVSNSVPPSPASRSAQFLVNKNEYYFLGKWRKSSKRILQKCFGFMRPLIRCSRKSNRVDDLERKVCEIRSQSNSLETSPRQSSAYSVVEWNEVAKIEKKGDFHIYGLKRAMSWSSSPKFSPRLSPSYSRDDALATYDAESSIHEAILYCKRTIEN